MPSTLPSPFRPVRFRFSSTQCRLSLEAKIQYMLRPICPLKVDADPFPKHVLGKSRISAENDSVPWNHSAPSAVSIMRRLLKIVGLLGGLRPVGLVLHPMNYRTEFESHVTFRTGGAALRLCPDGIRSRRDPRFPKTHCSDDSLDIHPFAMDWA